MDNHLKRYFWDIDADHFDPRDYPSYTIARLLEYGNLEAVSWLRNNFEEETIKDVVRTSRELSPKTATFRALVYDLPSEEITALNLEASKILQFP